MLHYWSNIFFSTERYTFSIGLSWSHKDLPCVLDLLRRSEIHLRWVDIPQLALEDDTIFVFNSVKWRHSMPHFVATILDYTIFFKPPKKRKSIHNQLEMIMERKHSKIPAIGW